MFGGVFRGVNSLVSAAACKVVTLPDGTELPCFARIVELKEELDNGGRVPRKALTFYYSGEALSESDIITYSGELFVITAIGHYTDTTFKIEAISA